jgi:hypothetical protein
MKFVIYNPDGTIYDIRYAKDGWILEKCEDVYSPKTIVVLH